MPREKKTPGDVEERTPERSNRENESSEEQAPAKENGLVPGFPLPDAWDAELMSAFALVDDATHRDFFFQELKKRGLPEMSVDEFFAKKDEFLEQCAKSVSKAYAEGEKRLADLEDERETFKRTSPTFAALSEINTSIFHTRRSLDVEERSLKRATESFEREKELFAQAELEMKESLVRPGLFSRLLNSAANKEYREKMGERDASFAARRQALEAAQKHLEEKKAAVDRLTRQLRSDEEKRKEIEDGPELKAARLKDQEFERRIEDDPYSEMVSWLETTYAHNRTDNGELPEHLVGMSRAERVTEILDELGHPAE